MIVFSDFDNTLHPHADEAGFRRNLEKIREFRGKGNLFCIATGRSQASLGRTLFQKVHKIFRSRHYALHSLNFSWNLF